MGLQVLYPPNEDGKAEAPQADIVAVHGLNGDPKDTWTDKKTNAFWLKDFLPRDVPNTRVMTFGYDANAAFGDTTAGIEDHAKGLLTSLVDKREEDDEARRPIIFIGHSLGGIVIKQALFQAGIEPRYNSISESTVGIIFLGTPHRGSGKAAYGKVLAAIATTVMNKPSPRLVDALQNNSLELQRLANNSRDQLAKYQVYSFYEMKPMKPLSTLIVEKHSALLDVKDEEQIPVNANHEEMCKFGEREDEAYERVFKRVRRMMKEQKTGIIGVPLTQSRSTNPAKRSYDEDSPSHHSKRAKTTHRPYNDRGPRKYHSADSDVSDDSDDDDDSADSNNGNASHGWQDDDESDLDSDENCLKDCDGVALASDSDDEPPNSFCFEHGLPSCDCSQTTEF